MVAFAGAAAGPCHRSVNLALFFTPCMCVYSLQAPCALAHLDSKRYEQAWFLSGWAQWSQHLALGHKKGDSNEGHMAARCQLQ
ncbi:MAG: hypothetical protein J3K34DRAFT_46921 [Monoraphidium minutum]|nr:MAG: hypothetical protein J3K34DRAFT_46921 [Monoraphidium minutum]